MRGAVCNGAERRLVATMTSSRFQTHPRSVDLPRVSCSAGSTCRFSVSADHAASHTKPSAGTCVYCTVLGRFWTRAGRNSSPTCELQLSVPSCWLQRRLTLSIRMVFAACAGLRRHHPARCCWGRLNAVRSCVTSTVLSGWRIQLFLRHRRCRTHPDASSPARTHGVVGSL